MEQKVISVDFDETLFIYSSEKVGLLWAATEVLVPVQKIHDLIFEKHKEGFIIDIVTSRNEWGIEEIRQAIAEYNLPIREVRWTAGQAPKSVILKKIQSVLHIDDMLHVAIDCKMNSIPVLLVDDGKHKGNSTAEEFDRIFV